MGSEEAAGWENRVRPAAELASGLGEAGAARDEGAKWGWAFRGNRNGGAFQSAARLLMLKGVHGLPEALQAALRIPRRPWKEWPGKECPGRGPPRANLVGRELGHFQQIKGYRDEVTRTDPVPLPVLDTREGAQEFPGAGIPEGDEPKILGN